jgi:tRNA A-37 threonylcarbamoyl transferase component Bud32
MLHRWTKVVDRLVEALESPDPERFVSDSGDAELAELFDWHRRAGSFLEGPPPSRPDPWIDRVIGSRYRLEAVLGRGGAGVVYRARDERVPGRLVAIKLLHDFWSSEDWMRRRFLAEAQMLARLDHPGIVSLTDAGETEEGRLFLAMPFHEGRTLRDALKDGALEPAFCARLLCEIGDAVDFAHRQGILHRDLKPENVLLVRREDREHPLLIDFGIAQHGEPEAARKTTTHLMGSAVYMAPEHLMGKATRESDAYSLAVLAWEMLAGRLPFDSDSPFALPALQRKGVGDAFYRHCPHLGVKTGRLLARALDFNPARRPSPVSAFTAELAEILTAGGIDSQFARLWVMRRSRRWLLGGAAVGLAGAGVVGWGLRDWLAPLRREERVIDFPAGYQAEMAGFTLRLQLAEHAIRNFPGGAITSMRYSSPDQGQLHKLLTQRQKEHAFRHGWKIVAFCRPERGYAAVGLSCGHFAPRFDAGFQVHPDRVGLIATRQLRAGWNGIRAAVSLPPEPRLVRLEMQYDALRGSATVSVDGRTLIRDYAGHTEYRDDMGVFFAVGSIDGSMGSAVFGGLRFEIPG